MSLAGVGSGAVCSFFFGIAKLGNAIPKPDIMQKIPGKMLKISVNFKGNDMQSILGRKRGWKDRKDRKGELELTCLLKLIFNIYQTNYFQNWGIPL